MYKPLLVDEQTIQIRTTSVTAKWEERLRRDFYLCHPRLTATIVQRIVTLSVVEFYETNGFTVKPKTLGKITTHLFFFPKTPFTFRPRAENAKQTRCTCRVCQRFWNKNIVEVRIVRRIIALSSAEYRKTNGFTAKLKKVDWNDASFFPSRKHRLFLDSERKRYASNGRLTYVYTLLT